MEKLKDIVGKVWIRHINRRDCCKRSNVLEIGLCANLNLRKLLPPLIILKMVDYYQMLQSHDRNQLSGKPHLNF